MRWERVETLADRAPRLTDLHFHRLELVAARLRRVRGEHVPPQLGDAERYAAVNAMAARDVLRRIRAEYGGRLLLMKGPEVAARYPDPALRPYRDLDLLVDDAPAAHRALQAAGFAPTGNWAPHVDLHHLQPLCRPGLPIAVELHSAPHFPDGLRAPALSELLRDAVPARFGDGIVEAPSPAAHTLIVAAHAWAHAPLAHIGQLVDVALLAAETDAEQLEALARRWRCARLWHATQATIGALLDDGAQMPLAARICAPHLSAVRERTLGERHIEELTSPLFGLPVAGAPAQTARVLARRLRRGDEETWSHKLRRARRALRNAGLRHSEHDARLPAEDRHIGGIPGLEPAPIPERKAGP